MSNKKFKQYDLTELHNLDSETLEIISGEYSSKTENHEGFAIFNVILNNWAGGCILGYITDDSRVGWAYALLATMLGVYHIAQSCKYCARANALKKILEDRKQHTA